jgi:glycosyltransferase involved in cell wall biosynthesis
MIVNNNMCDISLVICTYNRDKFLPEALESITKQSLSPHEFEVIIIDNNSTDKTKEISLKFISENQGLDIRYCFEANKGLSFARNRGIKEAKGNIITYVDDDAILTPDFLKNMLAFFRSKSTAVGVGGKVIPKYESGQEPKWYSKYVSAMAGSVNHGDSIEKYNANMKYPVGCNMTYTKSILEKAGGFNNQLTFRSDDKFIFHQVKKLSDEIYYLPDAMLYHYIDDERLEFKNFKKLYLKSGNEEKKRIKSEGSSLNLIKKGVELLLKLFASIILFFLFFIKGKFLKGQYTFLAMWFTLKGFIMKEVYVR